MNTCIKRILSRLTVFMEEVRYKTQKIWKVSEMARLYCVCICLYILSIWPISEKIRVK